MAADPESVLRFALRIFFFKKTRDYPVKFFCHFFLAQNGPKIGSSRYSGLLITNPGSDLLSDFAVSEQTAINVVRYPKIMLVPCRILPLYNASVELTRFDT